MRKILPLLVAILLVLLTVVIGASAYYVHTLPFNQRVDCATGEEVYLFLPSACDAYIKAFYSENTPEDRQEMSASLSRLMSLYDLNKNSAEANKALTLAALFIRRGADVNFVDDQGLTPLHAAVLHAEPVLIEFLIKHGADAEKNSFVPQIGKTLSPLDLAKKIAGEGNTDPDVDWQGIITVLQASSLQRTS